MDFSPSSILRPSLLTTLIFLVVAAFGAFYPACAGHNPGIDNRDTEELNKGLRPIAQAETIRIAVIHRADADFRDFRHWTRTIESQLDDRLKLTSYEVLGTGDIMETVPEDELMQCFDDPCLQQLGERLNARYLLASDFTQAYANDVSVTLVLYELGGSEGLTPKARDTKTSPNSRAIEDKLAQMLERVVEPLVSCREDNHCGSGICLDGRCIRDGCREEADCDSFWQACVSNRCQMDQEEDLSVLRVESEPSSADIYIDGTPMGKTPFERYFPFHGSIQLEVERAGYLTWNEIVNLEQEREYFVKLKSKLAQLNIRTQPPGRRIAVDGREKGVAGVGGLSLSLPPGTYKASIIDECSEPESQEITLEYGMTRDVILNADELTFRARVLVYDEEGRPLQGAIVRTSDGQEVRPGSSFDLSRCRNQVEIGAEGMAPKKLSIDPRADGRLVSLEVRLDSRYKVVKNSVGMAFVTVPEGTFVMGGEDTDCEYDKPPHRVRVNSSFRIGLTEVTRQQWALVMGMRSAPDDEAQLPQVNVSWKKVQEFLRRLNRMEKTGAYRLPMEAEWELAARGEDGRLYPWGDTLPQDGNEPVANLADRRYQGPAERIRGYDDSYSGLAPVGSFPAGASPFGALDMVGNVREWVHDCWHGNYRGAPSNGGNWDDGCQRGYRVVRGGGYGNTSEMATATYRRGIRDSEGGYDLGFRVVWEEGR